MVGAVVDDPEHSPGGAVALLGHHLADETVKRGDPAGALGPAHDLPAPHIPGIEVGDGAEPLVLVLDQLPAAGLRRRGFVDPSAGLDRWLGISRDHHVAGLQQLALPAALVEVEHPPSLLQEVGVAREDPRTDLPRLDRVL